MDRMKFINPNIDRIVWYINLETVFRVLLNPRVENMTIGSGVDDSVIKLQLISNIINLGQHYRLYAAKMKKESRVILYWNYPKAPYNNRKYLQNYRNDHDKRMHRNYMCERLSRCVTEVHDFIIKIMAYINQVYLVDGGAVESSLVPYYIDAEIYNKDGNPTQNIIVSKSKYDFQYIQYGFTVLSPSGENSLEITDENVIDKMKERGNIKNPLTVPAAQLPFVLALLGDTHRGIPSTERLGIAGIVKAIRAAIDNVQITDTTQDIEILASCIADKYREHFKRNYRCVNFSYQMKDVTPVQREHITSQLIDKYDDNTLEYINEQFFQCCPIMTIQTRSEQILNDDYTSPERSIFA